MRALRARLAIDPLAADALLALGLTALSIATPLAGARDIGQLDPASIALLLFQTLPLVACRRAPLAVLVVTRRRPWCRRSRRSARSMRRTSA